MRYIIPSVLLSLCFSISTVFAASTTEYVTWTGIGPDKWSSAWLIHRHIEPGATIRVIETGRQPESGMAFDIPEIPPYFRDAKRTTYESLIAGFAVKNPLLKQIGGIIHDIEVNFWGGKQSVAAPLVESAFRGLQFKYGRESVPQSCYFGLFDSLYTYLDGSAGNIQISNLEQAIKHDSRCGSVKHMTADFDKKYVTEWKPQEILAFLNAGDTVVFIDTRESDEFEEGHIPGAINIKLRDISGELPLAVKNADVVVPYCVKDFRGFEVAKRLKDLGVKTVGLMNPWGIAGWKSVGLPVSGTRGLQPLEAIQKLEDCVKQPSECIKEV